ncbi:DNA-binding protein [Methylobacterium sp. E-065]|uniref:helix-turn-helix transcriptional regulator n=1 Tax=Methylobacterium sp. E-065 TaxID=2836583 RepID=UPI001FB8AE56|nr:DNA-binding protein [Methylobacterium sp. E-065]MCJ2019438.1 DNA-binding protein [Methylobacterium sp. E-065]
MNYDVRSSDDLLPAAHVLARYQVSDMTLHRWLKNECLNFPKPIRINGRRYWRLGDLQLFESRQ